MHKSKVTNEVFDGGIFQKSKGQVKKAFMKQFQFVTKLCPRQLEKKWKLQFNKSVSNHYIFDH